MNNEILEYKDYIAQLHFDWKDNILVGRVINTREIISFHADSVSEIKQEFYDTIEDYIKICQKAGITVSKPYSGRINLRLDPTTHSKIAAQAAQHHLSLNSFAAQVLKNSVVNNSPIADC
jgi:predicted HicB family RNase H-like nuclease